MALDHGHSVRVPRGEGLPRRRATASATALAVLALAGNGAAALPEHPQVPAKVTPGASAVFFTVEGNVERGPLTLVPLHCYDAGKKALLVGDACLPLLPAGATVQTAGGPLQVGEATPLQCPRQPATMGGLRLRGKVKAVPFLYGAWPSLAAARYVSVPEANLAGAMAPVEALARRAIRASTGQPVADLAIYQIIALPLGGEHALRKVYSVAVPDRRGHTIFSGLLTGGLGEGPLMVAAQDAVELPGVKTLRHSMQVVGYMDLDHDGKLELVVNSGGDNLDRYSIRVYDGQKLPLVSYWHSCGD